MGRYEPLRLFLATHRGESVQMSFSEIERILGFALPRSARTYQAWWANDPKHVQAKAWIEAGAKSGQLDMKLGMVVFLKRGRTAPRLTEAAKASGFAEARPSSDLLAPHAQHPAIGAMKGMLTFVPGTDLTAPADPEWGQIAYGDE